MPTPEAPLDQAYWNTHWQDQQTGWDIGYASPAITAYMDQYPNKAAAILIPGCGNAYEAEYLAAQGFTNITLLDIAPKAVEMLRAKFAQAKAVQVLCGDFFQHQGQYDLLIEQTIFCAISPARRKEYLDHAASLLRNHGRIIGLLFDKAFEKPGPPFGGSKAEYQPLFEHRFISTTMERSYNSIPQRTGSELFINQLKK